MYSYDRTRHSFGLKLAKVVAEMGKKNGKSFLKKNASRIQYGLIGVTSGGALANFAKLDQAFYVGLNCASGYKLTPNGKLLKGIGRGAGYVAIGADVAIGVVDFSQGNWQSGIRRTGSAGAATISLLYLSNPAGIVVMGAQLTIDATLFSYKKHLRNQHLNQLKTVSKSYIDTIVMAANYSADTAAEWVENCTCCGFGAKNR